MVAVRQSHILIFSGKHIFNSYFFTRRFMTLKNYIRTSTVAITVVLLAAALMFAALSQTTVNAQESTDAIVIIAPSQGGTTDPAPGTYTYANGTEITLTATASPGFTFQYWVASGGFTPGHTEGQVPGVIDPETGEPVGPIPPRPSISGIDSLVFTTNPATIECGFGYTYTYQAVFATEGGEPVTGDSAIVVIQPATGGTTDPAPGTRTYPNGTVVTLTATPDEGYSFHYWVISGNVTPGHAQGQNATIITDPETGEIVTSIPRPPVPTGIDSLVVDVNPIEIECGFGYTFVYQPVFTESNETDHSPSPGVTESPGVTVSPGVTESPSVTASPSPGVTATASPTGGQIIAGIDDWILIVIVAIVIIVIIAAIAAAMRRR